MRYMKRILALALSALMLLSLMPAAAAEAVDEMTVVYVDPVAAANGVQAPGAPTLIPREDPPLFYTPEDAAAHIRSQMVARVGTFQVALKCATRFTIDDLNNITALVFSHTGVGVEGDYLRYHSAYRCGAKLYGYSDGTFQAVLTVNATYYTDNVQESMLTYRIASVSHTLGLADMTSDFEKFKAIYDYIARNVVYDTTHDSAYTLKYSAYAAMVDHSAVCQGYTSLLYRMLLENGVDCRVMAGVATPTGQTGAQHTWSIVKLDGKWYYCDLTWDATYLQADYHYLYCLRGRDTDLNEDDGKLTSFLGEHIPNDDLVSLAVQVESGDYLTPDVNGEYTRVMHVSMPGVACVISNCDGGRHYHTETPMAEVAPTCTHSGSTGGVYCSTCGQVLVAATTIPPTGHGALSLVGYFPATDVTDGYTGDMVCTVCGEIAEKGWAIPCPLHQHTLGSLAPVPPTCTEGGLSMGTGCVTCGEVINPQEILPPTGHNYGEGPVFTWTADGSACTATFTCLTDPSHTLTMTAQVTTSRGKRIATVVHEGVTYTNTLGQNIPATGDSSAPALWLIMLALSAAGLLALRRRA